MTKSTSPLAQPSRAEYEELRRLIRRVAGIELGHTRQVMVSARLQRRMRDLGVGSFAEYLVALRNRESELQELINCIATNKTEFFREAHHFELLRAKLARSGPVCRIWSAACSTGEEPYSVAMTALEYLRPLGIRVEVIASDIDTDALSRAKAGVYTEESVSGIPPEMRSKYLMRDPQARNTWRVRDEARALVDFRHVNLIDPSLPITGPFDAIFCRNVMIYFDRETQRQVMDRLTERLRPQGILLLGHSEGLLGVSDRFVRIGHTAYVSTSAPVTHVDTASIGQPIVQLAIDQMFTSSKPTQVNASLGSCVAVCVFDSSTATGGMKRVRSSEAAEDHHAARHSVGALISRLLSLGASRKQLQAKVVGGASLHAETSSEDPNESAIAVVGQLERFGIPIVGRRLGGSRSREVRFSTHDGRLLCRELEIDPSALTQSK